MNVPQVALVTGASSGIGAAVARRFGQAGWTVVLAARTEPKLQEVAREIERAGGRAVVAPTDVGKPDAVERLAASVRALGRLDALVNAAGVGYDGRVEGMDLEIWEETIATNLRGPFLVCRALYPLFSEGTTIVNVASVIALDGAASLSAYSASKHGLRGFSQALAKELAPKRVRVVSLNPGFVATPMVEGAPHRFEDMIQPADLAEVVWFACHQPESAYVDEITVWPRLLYGE